jgi:ketosteroid isomerase-like protein
MLTNSGIQASELARKYIETLGAGRLDECMNLFREDAGVFFPKSLNAKQRVGKEEFRAMFEGARSIFEVWPQYTLLHQTSEGNRSCIEFRGVGKLKSGREFENLYCIIFVAEGGLITELREYLDTYYMLTIFAAANARDPA